jgi:hypothetical protein
MYNELKDKGLFEGINCKGSARDALRCSDVITDSP